MRLQRVALGKNGKPTVGNLVSHDGRFSCVTLERSVDGDHPCIPAGTYKVSWTVHHPGTQGAYRCPLLDTSALVPPRSEIQMHVANRCAELLGCIAVGNCVDGDAIDCSQDAFDRLVKYLEGVVTWELEIIDPVPVLA